jgi:hypothetical protein
MNKKKSSSDEFFSDWTKSSHFKFPHIQPHLVREQTQQQEMFYNLKSENKIKHELEMKRNINKIDIDFNLKLLMYADQKYINTARLTEKTIKSDVFEPFVVKAILNNARKTYTTFLKQNDNVNIDELQLEPMDMNKFRINIDKKCLRHQKNIQKYEDNKFNKPFYMKTKRIKSFN